MIEVVADYGCPAIVMATKKYPGELPAYNGWFQMLPLMPGLAAAGFAASWL